MMIDQAYLWNIIHWATVTILSWVSFSDDNFALTESSLYAILRFSIADAVSTGEATAYALSTQLKQWWRNAPLQNPRLNSYVVVNSISKQSAPDM